MNILKNEVLVCRFPLICCLVLLTPAFAWANPSSREPSKPIVTHNTIPGANELAASLYSTWAAIEKFVIQSEATLTDKGAAKLQASAIAQGLWKTEQSLRDATRLRIMGEPAGVDLNLRLTDLSVRLSALAGAHAATPPGMQWAGKSFAFIDKESPNRQREFARLQSLAEAQKYTEMEKSLDKFGKELCDAYNYISGYDLAKYYQPYYSKFRQLLENSKTEALQATVDQKYSTLITEMQPDPAAVLAWASNAVEQLKTTGKATIEGVGPVGGPELVDELIKRSASGHTALQRIQGLRWAWGRDAENQNAKMSSEIATWSEATAEAFVTFVKADAEIVKPGDVPLLYQQYLKRAATFMKMGDATKWQAKATDAFTALLAKNSGYETSVKAYEASTKDLLIFQNRIADQQQTSLEAQFAKADHKVRHAAKIEGNTPGLYLDTPGTISTATLHFPADQTVVAIAPKLTDSFVCLQDVRSISPTSKLAAVRFNGRTYGRAVVVSIPEQQVAITKQRWLVDDAHEPLSLEAAHALQAMQSGDYRCVGGKIVSFQLEPMVTRFVSMVDAISQLVPYGSAMEATADFPMINQVSVQIDIDPIWVRTELGVFRIPTKELDRSIP